jgi:hypothetical protein
MEINMYDKRSVMKQKNMELLLKKKEDLELLLKEKEKNLKLYDVKINALFDLHSEQEKYFKKYKAICEDILATAKETDKRLATMFPFNGLNISCSCIEVGLADASTSIKQMQFFKKDLADEIQLLKQKIAGCHLRLKVAENANAKAKIKETENTETTETAKAKIKKTSEINSSVGRNLASRYRETVGILQKLKSAKAMDVYSFLSDDVAKTVSYIQFRSWLNKQAQKENNIIVYDAKRPSGTGAKATTYKISL